MTKGAREELLLLLLKCVRYDIIISPINKNLTKTINVNDRCGIAYGRV